MDYRSKQIRQAIDSNDLKMLKKLATTGSGFINSKYRRQCWPLLMQCNSQEEIKEGSLDDISLKDRKQVAADAKRSFINFPKDILPERKAQKQVILQDVILTVLRRHLDLCYYQGFHDVCSYLLLILDKEAAIMVAERLVVGQLKDAMGKSLDPFMRFLSLVSELVRQEDNRLYKFLEENGIFPQPVPCLSWLMTWCSHDIHDIEKLGRLFDFLLASDASMCAYFTCAVILSQRKEILSQDNDQGSMHVNIARFPQDSNLDVLVSKAVSLHKKYANTREFSRFNQESPPNPESSGSWIAKLRDIKEMIATALQKVGRVFGSPQEVAAVWNDIFERRGKVGRAFSS